MCKNLMIVGIKPDKQKEKDEFMFAMAPRMTAGDRDGLGYAAMTENGLFGERWFHPEDAFKYRPDDPFILPIKHDDRYNNFMENDKVSNSAPFAIIMHARMATCERALKNVHPFVNNGTALIHNGVIGNDDDKHLRKTTSTCDSEVILNSYIDHDVANNPDNIDKVAKDLTGGYACGVLTKNKEGVHVLDLFRNNPMLWGLHIKELDAIVFCTSSQMVIDTCRDLKWKIGSIFRFKDQSLLRIDARTGVFLSGHGFSGSYYTSGNWHSNRNRHNHNSGSSSTSSANANPGESGTAATMGPSELPVVTPASTPILLGADKSADDSEGSLGDATIISQEEIELGRSTSKPLTDKEKDVLGFKGEKKTATHMRRSPKAMELDRIATLRTTTGTDSVVIEPMSKTLH